jgi:ABC-2 type transport system permease protein
MPIAFISTAFVPAALTPDWLRVVNDWNPISYVIEAMRSLMMVGVEGDVLGRAIVAIVVLAVVLQGATLWAFRRQTALTTRPLEARSADATARELRPLPAGLTA